MTERYVAPDISDWLGRLRTALPPHAVRQDGTQLDRAALIGEIAQSFAHLMSTEPDYSRGVTDHVHHAVRCLARGNGNHAETAIRRAHDAVPGHAAGHAVETRTNTLEPRANPSEPTSPHVPPNPNLAPR